MHGTHDVLDLLDIIHSWRAGSRSLPLGQQRRRIYFLADETIRQCGSVRKAPLTAVVANLIAVDQARRRPGLYAERNEKPLSISVKTPLVIRFAIHLSKRLAFHL